MTETNAKRHKSGLLVVVILGMLFFILLILLVLSAGKKRPITGPLENETLTVLPPKIRLRTEPNAKAPVVATAGSGEKLESIEDRGAWVRVKNPDGLEGWVERGTVERSSERERRLARFAAIRKLPPLRGLVTERTALYAGPGIFYPIVGELSEGARVQVFTRDHDFYAVGQDDQIAYADIDAVNVTAGGGSQFAVKTNPAAAPQNGTASPTETMIPEPAPVEASPPPMIAAETDRSGVYTAVPPGGTQPDELDRVIPRYPIEARAANVEGPVVIRGIVRKDGTIDNVEIIRDLPYGLGEAARRAVQQWRFRPATFHGEPIDVYYTVTVNFRLR